MFHLGLEHASSVVNLFCVELHSHATGETAYWAVAMVHIYMEILEHMWKSCPVVIQLVELQSL